MNPMDLLKNFQNMQSQVGNMQEKMKGLIVTGTSGGDMVKIEMNGQMEVTNVTISPEAVDPDDIGMLQDLIFAACTDASVKIKDKMREEMSSITGGMDLPPGLFGM
ncbi:MAG: YbaB/EbfC family nucleoid-associated protein [Spirochaetales bacterium]|jgi:nucleoid-associated protein EbfC|nr:YbaB/EbfC family nucleoid-associated protein [Spirochaetales bacterium]